jgi:uncharacterized FAD-dependent dehydrogenase
MKGAFHRKTQMPQTRYRGVRYCTPCNIPTGFSGSGSFSDGKSEHQRPRRGGRRLIHYIGHDRFRECWRTPMASISLLELTLGCMVTTTRRCWRISAAKLPGRPALCRIQVRHLGTEKAYEIYAAARKSLKPSVLSSCSITMVMDLIV